MNPAVYQSVCAERKLKISIPRGHELNDTFYKYLEKPINSKYKQNRFSLLTFDTGDNKEQGGAKGKPIYVTLTSGLSGLPDNCVEIRLCTLDGYAIELDTKRGWAEAFIDKDTNELSFHIKFVPVMHRKPGIDESDKKDKYLIWFVYDRHISFANKEDADTYPPIKYCTNVSDKKSVMCLAQLQTKLRILSVKCTNKNAKAYISWSTNA